MFVNAHLHSGQDAVEKRNADLAAAMGRFVHQNIDDEEALSSRIPDLLIFVGDLNYRVDGFKESIVQAMSADKYELLLPQDQLFIEQELGNVTNMLKEGKIEFAPTFKRKQFDNNAFGMKRNPSWTDRILYHCNTLDTEDRLKLKSYDSNNLVMLSDHRPVFAQFEYQI